MKTYICLLWVVFGCIGWEMHASVDVHPTFITTSDGLANNSVRYLFQDSKGFIWMGTLDGLSRYDGHSFVTFRPESGDKISLANHHVKKIQEDRNGFLWFITAPELMSCYDLKHDCFVDFTGCGEYRRPYNKILETAVGDIWLWHHQSGCRKIVCKDGIHSSVSFTKENGKLSTNAVNSVYEDEQGVIWICTQLGLFQVTEEGYTQVVQDSLSFVGAMSFRHKIFFVTSDGGIYEKSSGKNLFLTARLPWKLSAFNTYESCRLQNDWVFFTPEGGEVFSMSEKRLIYDSSLDIRLGKCEKDNLNNLWISNGTGLVHYIDVRTRAVRIFRLMSDEKVKLIGDERYHIIQDVPRGLIWISTYGNGLFVYDSQKEEMTHYSYHVDEFNRVNSDFLLYAMGDRTGNIWLGSEYSGIALLSVLMPGNVYLESSACVMKNGHLLFGTNHGLVVVDPEKVMPQHVVSPVVLTDLKINGISVRPGDIDSPLTEALSYTNRIELKYYQNSFSIDFSTFDYSMANDAKYIYKLIPYDKDWGVPSSLNFAAYKNLLPGTYQLHVKASSASGVWGEDETVLQIVITPPFWKTGWAFAIYIMLICMAMYMTFRLIHKFAILRNRIQLEKQLTEYKLVFFTNISHEFRTPLTLIQGALEKIEAMGRGSKELAYPIKVMDRSTQRMLRLINQLLEFRKMQNNKLVLSLEETDVIVFLYDIFLSFRETAESKEMEFKFIPSVSSYPMFVDKGKLDKIVYNLLSNAFKYTPEGGKIVCSVDVEEETKKLIISVSDTGIGIPLEKRGQLFSRFMQSSFSGDSMGIGLHLTHELVNVHKGSIEYAENEGQGSVFTVTLPLNSSVYESKDFLISTALMEETDHTDEGIPCRLVKEEQMAAPLNKKKILIIEDDTDIREFLKKEISVYFEVVAEADGVAGFERARTYDADLIICDVLMPGMNGYEVTRKLKNEFSTSHIPIILLTAMGTTENKLEGVESGADAYVTKPFSLKLLLARMVQLIDQREKLREKYVNDPSIERPAIYTSDKDKQFLDKLQAIIEQELGNSEFTMEDFAARMKLGRTVFSKKVRGLTGHTPNEYFRIIRLKKAAELLLEGNYNVSEVSYKVGISDPLYFSRCFKTHYGVSPSVYLRGKEKEI